MKVDRLELNNFRNYSFLDLKVSPHINILMGENAQGKTNILEAIAYFSNGTSQRIQRQEELIKEKERSFYIKLEFINRDQRKEEIEISFPQQDKPTRLIKVNKLTVPRLSDLYGNFNTVLFSPDDLLLVKQGPSKRRNYLNLLITQYSSAYFRKLQEYQNFLKQRNALLKQIKVEVNQGRISIEEIKKFSSAGAGNRVDLTLLNLQIWTEQLIDVAVDILQYRAKCIAKISSKANSLMQEISENKESLEVKYRTYSHMQSLILALQREEIAEEEFRQKSKEKIRERYFSVLVDDVFSGRTSQGTHLDDLEIVINDKSVKSFASQGQQRSAVLALKLAELQIIEEETKNLPVLLLDDVLSELDKKRRQKLLKMVERNQVFISCTDIDKLSINQEIKKRAKIFEVKQGKVYVH